MFKKILMIGALPAIPFLFTQAVYAEAHAMAPAVMASDQDASNGIVSAESIVAPANGWLVVHRTDADMAPGPVIGHAPIREGETADVAAILTEDVAPGDMLMLMVHGEDGGERTGIFEYTLGATEDGPIRLDGDLVMTVITAQ
ncbi:hypothetical protein GCM10023209_24080 [Roseibacterium beibuensis]|uniref:DUF7282 domain-containing protein n=3 Tax=[Roseibacterium] beibuensis TaxID=1193142 RepID=A0ABP9LG19_9RHOB